MLLKRVFLVLLLGIFLAALTGCDGEGVFLNIKKAADGYDVPDGDEDDDQDDDGSPDPIDPDTTSLGNWITSYVDDDARSAAENGQQAYAVTMKLDKAGSDITGTGTMFRVFESGATAADSVSVKAAGTISGDDASFSITSATAVPLADTAYWRLRFAGNNLVGAYRSLNASNQHVRNGHALWRKQTTANLNGAWVSAYGDIIGTASMPPRDRTATMVLTHNTADQTLTGTGNLVEQVPGQASSNLGFNLLDGKVNAPKLGWTMGDLDMASNEVDWYGVSSNGLIAGAFAQYDVSDRLIRSGAAKWYVSSVSTPGAVDATWATSFCDAGVGTGTSPSCYLATLTLQAQEGNVVTGSAELVDVGSDIGATESLVVENGAIVGSHVTLRARQPMNGDVFNWDLRLGAGVMVGSYQLRNGLGQYVSTGTAEWRKQLATPTTVGTWVASYYDRSNTVGNRLSQLALVNVTSQATDGTLSGTGALRYMNGDNARKLFNLVNSAVLNKDITMVWRGPDLSGDTTWRLRHAGDNLFGVYENLTSAGNLESIGAATWIKTSTSNL